MFESFLGRCQQLADSDGLRKRVSVRTRQVSMQSVDLGDIGLLGEALTHLTSICSPHTRNRSSLSRSLRVAFSTSSIDLRKLTLTCSRCNAISCACVSCLTAFFLVFLIIIVLDHFHTDDKFNGIER